MRRVAELLSLGGFRMYWALTGYVGGFAAAFILHSCVSGRFTFHLLCVIPLLALFMLWLAVDVEAWFLSRWGREIAQRRAAGILTWRFCTGLGAVVGAVIYPIVALCWHFFLDDPARDRSAVGIALIVVSIGTALLLVWYLLMRYPKSNDAA